MFILLFYFIILPTVLYAGDLLRPLPLCMVWICVPFYSSIAFMDEELRIGFLSGTVRLFFYLLTFLAVAVLILIVLYYYILRRPSEHAMASRSNPHSLVEYHHHIIIISS